MELDMKATGKIAANKCAEYRAASKKAKGRILDEIIHSVGGNRDYWAWKLHNYNRVVYAAVADGKQPIKYVAKDRKKGEKHPGGRPRYYDDAFIKVLTKLWFDFGRRTPDRFLPDIREMIDYICEDGSYEVTDDIRGKLLKISDSEADRLLAPARKEPGLEGISTTKPGRLDQRSKVPVCTWHDRLHAKPGEFCSDTVAHCGASASGQFCKSLTYRDFYSGWLEERGLLNAAAKWVREKSGEIKAGLPFPMISVHDDDGGEYINIDFISWCIEEHIKQTRSRPNHKNDNALAEQTNFDAVRKTVGYFRFDTEAEYEALCEVYTYLCPLYNYWFHSEKLIGKETLANGKTKKIYEKTPKTPYERLMESPDVSDESKAELKRRKDAQNPVELNRKLNEAVDKLLQINSEKDKVKQGQAKA
jgi:hypothetical protein